MIQNSATILSSANVVADTKLDERTHFMPDISERGELFFLLAFFFLGVGLQFQTVVPKSDIANFTMTQFIIEST